MAIRYSNIQAVRDASGVDSGLIPDAEVTRILEQVEFRLEAYFDAVFTPTLSIDVLDGTGLDRVLLDRNPVLQVKAVKSDGTSINPSGIDISEGSGYIYLNEDASLSRFTRKRKQLFVEYMFGWLDEARSTTSPFGVVQTRLNGAYSLVSASGDSSATLTVDDGSLFSENDVVRVWGMDGNRETTTITSIAANVLTVDFISKSHLDDSYVTKLQTPEWFKELVSIVAGIKVVGNLVGAQYDEITGYELGEMRIQKGEPYTQWRETIIRLVEQRNEILKTRTIRGRVS